MKKRLIIITLFILLGYAGKAQVKDISFTLSPAAEYTWWDDKSGFEDNVLVGGKLGFGFGEYLELRGIYLQSLDLKTSFQDFGLENYDATLFNSQDVTLSRWGGEFKANLGTKRLKPYITLGTGVQTIDLDGVDDFEQIYATAGLGVKFNIAKRFVFSLEGKNTTYKFNSGANLLSADDLVAFGVTEADFENERLSNWSVQGALQFYLGGRKPGVLSDLDKAYLQKFKGGLKGLRFIIEPSLAYTNFDDGSLLRDTYWLGGFAGVDFNEYIGVRGFYFQATKEEQLSTDFDDLSMYGAEFRARLNDGNGVTPFLILGGGYLNPMASYVTTPDAIDPSIIRTAESGAFATGGIGLNIPLGKYVFISGGARAMVTSGDNVTDISNTDDIQTSVFYNAGLKFTLGKKAKSPNEVYEESVKKVLSDQQSRNDQKLDKLKKEYQDKIESLEVELKEAYAEKDVEKAVEILEEKKIVEEALQEVKDVEKVQEKQIKEQIIEEANKEETPVDLKVDKKLVDSVITEKTASKSKEKLIKMTPIEFEYLIDRILRGLDEEPQQRDAAPLQGQVPKLNNNDKDVDYLNKRIDLLEKLLLEVNTKRGTGTVQTIEDKIVIASNDKMNEASEKILDRLEDLNKKIDRNTRDIKKQNQEKSTIVVTPSNGGETKTIVSTIDENGNVIKTEEVSSNDQLLTYTNSSVFVGANVGGITSGNFGIRSYFNIKNIPLKFIPEVSIGLGSKTTWGISGNVVYPIELKTKKFEPYAGIGLGFGDLESELEGFYNVVFGTSLPLLNNKLFVDYTMRNSFNYNQIAIGYKLTF